MVGGQCPKQFNPSEAPFQAQNQMIVTRERTS